MRRRIVMALSLLAIAGWSAGGWAEETSLTVTFADPQWTGGAVPQNQVCSRFGGTGATPRLKVDGVPPGADAIILSFSDEDYLPMGNGGHGVLRFKIAGGPSVTLVSVPGETDQLPDGVAAEQKHRGAAAGGVYMPPCSGGRGHHYTAEVRAIKSSSDPSKPAEVLARGKITIGTF